jgi:hypothetical protein
MGLIFELYWICRSFNTTRNIQIDVQERHRHVQTASVHLLSDFIRIQNLGRIDIPFLHIYILIYQQPKRNAKIETKSRLKNEFLITPDKNQKVI